ncbi:PID-CTERM protein-sorting domain-containing protein [Polaribacter sp. SA4-10]
MPPPPPPGLLIDGYTVLLFIVGLIYGVKKIYK